MAIRRPGINSPAWLFQDFFFSSNGTEELRYLVVKWDGEIYTRESQSFDYSDPPFVGPEQKGGDIVAQVDYTRQGNIITVNDWDVNWRDEWPLRLAANYLTQCLYPIGKGFVIRVRGEEEYDQAGNPIQVANKDGYAFWVSEQVFPINNIPSDFLYR